MTVTLQPPGSATDYQITARQGADYYRSMVLPLRRQITQQTQLQYNAILVGAFQLLQAKQAEVEAGVQYIESLRDYWLARTRLDQITSGRLADVAETASTATSSASSASADGRGSGGH